MGLTIEERRAVIERAAYFGAGIFWGQHDKWCPGGVVARMRGAQFTTTPSGWHMPANDEHKLLANAALCDVAEAMGFAEPGPSHKFLREMRRRGKRILRRLKE